MSEPGKRRDLPRVVMDPLEMPAPPRLERSKKHDRAWVTIEPSEERLRCANCARDE